MFYHLTKGNIICITFTVKSDKTRIFLDITMRKSETALVTYVHSDWLNHDKETSVVLPETTDPCHKA